MTERTGGSDISKTETIALVDPNGDGKTYKLFGYKFFTSATTANTAFALARIEENGKSVPGSKGLSLFVVRVRNPQGQLNNIQIMKLKDKFGTKSVPTAELQLNGTPARLIGKIGEGVKQIAVLFNVTRVYTVVWSASFMSKMMLLMRDYAKKRVVFGKNLSEQPLHIATLSRLEMEYRGCVQLFVKLCLLLGESETTSRNENNEALLRILTPLGKLFCSKKSVTFMTEAMESFGGAGYMEDTGIPYFMRECMVNTIWEGTTNVLALDVLRCLTKEPETFIAFESSVNSNISNAPIELRKEKQSILEAFASCSKHIKHVENHDCAENIARAFSYGLARIYIGSLLIEHASHSKKESDILTAQMWISEEPLELIFNTNSKKIANQRNIAFGLDYQNEQPIGSSTQIPNSHHQPQPFSKL